jgi:predicted DNA-binding protein (MmcQ/YjbR family)
MRGRDVARQEPACWCPLPEYGEPDNKMRQSEKHMSRKLANAICRKFPGAEVSDPWGGGHDAWKVGGKMFACIGAVMPGVSVKTDSVETAQMLIDAGVGVKAPYFHRSWVNLPWGTSEDELRHRLTASYRLVRSGLTKKAQAELDPFETAAPSAKRRRARS